MMLKTHIMAHMGNDGGHFRKFGQDFAILYENETMNQKKVDDKKSSHAPLCRAARMLVSGLPIAPAVDPQNEPWRSRKSKTSKSKKKK